MTLNMGLSVVEEILCPSEKKTALFAYILIFKMGERIDLI